MDLVLFNFSRENAIIRMKMLSVSGRLSRRMKSYVIAERKNGKLVPNTTDWRNFPNDVVYRTMTVKSADGENGWLVGQVLPIIGTNLRGTIGYVNCGSELRDYKSQYGHSRLHGFITPEEIGFSDEERPAEDHFYVV